MVSRFRIMRLYCHLQLNEIAAAANISPQRLNQIETMYWGFKPKNPERLIQAMEMVITRRKREIEKIEYICRNERETIFDCVKGGEEL